MCGLAIDIKTPVTDIINFLPHIDLICLMAVKTGAGGQKFNEEVLDKIKEVRKLNKKILIELDGGINALTAPKCVKAGADILAAGSFIYENDTYEAIQTLKGKNG